MRNWIRSNKGIAYVSILFSCLIIAITLYVCFGHWIMMAIYEGRAGIMNGLIQRPVLASPWHYFDIADGKFLNLVRVFPKITVFYILVVVFIFLRNILVGPNKFFIFFGLFLFFLEFASRVYLFGFDCFNYFKVDSFHELGVSGLIKPASHLEMLYEWKPNLDTYFEKARLKTNSQGLRDKEYSIKKPPNTFRVAVLGPSIAVPSGVNIEDAFHSLLEERLNRESSGVKYEFINFAVNGYNLRQCLAALKYKAVLYDPDLILLSFPRHRDLPEEVYHQVYPVKPRTYPFFESFFVKLVNNIPIETLFKKEINQGKNRELLMEQDNSYWEDALHEFKKISETKGPPLCVLFFEEPNVLLRGISTRDGFYFVNIAKSFNYMAFGRKFRVSPLNTHPNASANKIFAYILYEFLMKQGLFRK